MTHDGEEDHGDNEDPDNWEIFDDYDENGKLLRASATKVTLIENI